VIKTKDERKNGRKKNSFLEGRSFFFFKKEETLDNDQRGVEKKVKVQSSRANPFLFQVHIHIYWFKGELLP
jgi:hypothetical protein